MRCVHPVTCPQSSFPGTRVLAERGLPHTLIPWRPSVRRATLKAGTRTSLGSSLCGQVPGPPPDPTHPRAGPQSTSAAFRRHAYPALRPLSPQAWEQRGAKEASRKAQWVSDEPGMACSCPEGIPFAATPVHTGLGLQEEALPTPDLGDLAFLGKPSQQPNDPRSTRAPNPHGEQDALLLMLPSGTRLGHGSLSTEIPDPRRAGGPAAHRPLCHPRGAETLNVSPGTGTVKRPVDNPHQGAEPEPPAAEPRRWEPVGIGLGGGCPSEPRTAPSKQLTGARMHPRTDGQTDTRSHPEEQELLQRQKRGLQTVAGGRPEARQWAETPRPGPGPAGGLSPGCRPAAGSGTSTCRPPRCAARPRARGRRRPCPRPRRLCRGQKTGAVTHGTNEDPRSAGGTPPPPNSLAPARRLPSSASLNGLNFNT